MGTVPPALPAQILFNNKKPGTIAEFLRMSSSTASEAFVVQAQPLVDTGLHDKSVRTAMGLTGRNGAPAQPRPAAGEAAGPLDSGFCSSIREAPFNILPRAT